MATSPRSPSEDSHWVFGEFELDASRFELRRAGRAGGHAEEAAPAPHLSLPELGSARALARALGSSRDVAVTEASLRGAIKVLRRTLLGSATIESSRGLRLSIRPSDESPRSRGSTRSPERRSPSREGRARSAFCPRERAVGATASTSLHRTPRGARSARASARSGLSGRSGAGARRGAGGDRKDLADPRVREARSSGKDFAPLVGQAWEGGGAPPFWPWGPLLEQLAFDGESVGFDRPVEGATTRFRLFADVVALLRRRAEQEPLLLVLEDLHWAEEPTLLLLKFVVEQLHGSRVLLVGTYRDSVLEGRAASASLIGLPCRPRGQQISLKPFSPSEVVSLLEAETSLEVTEALVARVLHWTGGSLVRPRADPAARAR